MVTGSRKLSLSRLLVFYMAALGVLAVIGWMPKVLPYSVASPMLPPNVRLTDLLYYKAKIDHMSGPVMGGPGPTFNYPAPAAYVFAFFLRSATPVKKFYACAGLAMLLFVAAAWHILQSSRDRSKWIAAAFFGTIAVSTPFYFALDRGNLEWVSWIFVVLALSCFLSRRYLATALLLGLAVCMKPFPILFFLLLLHRKRYRETLVGLAVAGGITAFCIDRLGPSFLASYRGLSKGFATYFSSYVTALHPRLESRFDHALMGLLRKAMSIHFIVGDDPMSLSGPAVPLWARLDLWYYFFVLVALATVLFIAVWYRRRPVTNTILAISVACSVLPFASAEYTLLNLFFPLLLVLIALQQQGSRVDLWQAATLGLLGLALLPLGPELRSYVGAAKCCILIALFICSIKSRFVISEFDRYAQA
ncbi:glycosyltransferase 87 family protein [Terriglobus aquaticus]|uniref:Glycosyltransferase 87 family protein n=1 Tax=Terriglobus aquaticus TaxID=940139 RepID=A0ABW9KMB5_9BACT|nr:glycosyltransferase 87 family protein [Terriglobus aquaticus]